MRASRANVFKERQRRKEEKVKPKVSKSPSLAGLIPIKCKPLGRPAFTIFCKPTDDFEKKRASIEKRYAMVDIFSRGLIVIN